MIIPTVLTTHTRYEDILKNAASKVAPEDNTLLWGDSNNTCHLELSGPRLN